mmetsp:Transcript_35525/g.76699  ORF Transcript_35525/g.76699 Transcript_35525/m.76699 type:complete len:85 (+) Transcript_35525:945-1199(+)
MPVVAQKNGKLVVLGRCSRMGARKCIELPGQYASASGGMPVAAQENGALIATSYGGGCVGTRTCIGRHCFPGQPSLIVQKKSAA